MLTEEEKKNVDDAVQIIRAALELAHKQGKIGNYGYGQRSYEQGVWDPKKKKTMADYIKAVKKILSLGRNHPFQFGFIHTCFVCNPQNTHKYMLLESKYESRDVFMHYTDIVNYDAFMRELDDLARLIYKLDLRKFTDPSNKKLHLVN